MDKNLMGPKAYWIETRMHMGTIQETAAGTGFVTDSLTEGGAVFRVVSVEKDRAIDEIIANLQGLKDSSPLSKKSIQ